MQLQSRILNSTSFMAQFAIAMINLALVYHMRLQFNLSPQLIGVSASIYTFTYFISCLALGPIATRLKPRHSVSLSVAGMGISIAVVMVTTSIAVAFVALAGYGIAMSFLWPQIETWLARGKEGRALNKATSSFNVSWSLGAATSPLLTGILVEIHTRVPLFAGIMLFGLVFSLIGISTKMVPGIRAVVSEYQNIQQTTAIDQSTPLRFLSWAGVLTVYAALAVILTIFPLHALDNLPFSESAVGLLLLVRGLATVGMFVVMGKTSWWHFKRTLVIIIQILVVGICLLGTLSFSFFHYILFFFVFGMLFAMMYSFSIFHGASGSIHRSKRMLIHEMLLTIGTIVGSIVGGTVYQYLDFTRVLYACSVLVAIPIIIALLRNLLSIKRKLPLY